MIPIQLRVIKPPRCVGPGGLRQEACQRPSDRSAANVRAALRPIGGARCEGEARTALRDREPRVAGDQPSPHPSPATHEVSPGHAQSPQYGPQNAAIQAPPVASHKPESSHSQVALRPVI